MCNFNEQTCELMNDELNVGYNLKKASFAKDGKLQVSKAIFCIFFLFAPPHISSHGLPGQAIHIQIFRK